MIFGKQPCRSFLNSSCESMTNKRKMKATLDYAKPGNLIGNRILSGLLALKYRVTEQILLRIMRSHYRVLYEKGKDQGLITIVIATYNRGKILTERTIPSILNQSYQNFEILVIGDKCIDNTPLLITNLKDSRIRFYDLPQRGKYPSNAESCWFVQGVAPRNKGLKLAKGSWLAWISDDDILLPHHLEELLRSAKQGNYEFVSAAYTCEKNGEIITRRASDYNPPIGGMQTWLYRSYLKFFKWNIHSWRKSWDRPCDYDLQYRMLSAGVRMGFIDDIVAHVPAVEGTNTVGLEAQRRSVGIT